MVRWLFFSHKLPHSWEWWTIRETLIYTTGFVFLAMLIVLYVMPPDASADMKGNSLLLMFLLLWFYVRVGLKYAFGAGFCFAWGIALTASTIIIPLDLWGSIGLALIGFVVALRAYSTGPAPARRRV